MRGVLARFEADTGQIRCSSGSKAAADLARRAV
jgi:hypothetical protein